MEEGVRPFGKNRHGKYHGRVDMRLYLSRDTASYFIENAYCRLGILVDASRRFFRADLSSPESCPVERRFRGCVSLII